MKAFLAIAAFVIAATAAVAALQPGASMSKAALGERLFFDTILSYDRTVSCATCHKPAFAFADTSARSTGVDGRTGTRNTPSAMNVRLQRSFFWDGRAASLEEQALMPIENPAEMNLPIELAIDRLRQDEGYREAFQNVFNSSPTKENLAQAIAAFERTLETSDSPFDNWRFSGDEQAVPEAAKRGFALFNTKGKCVKCHFGADFTTNTFRNIGLFDGKKLNDSGRALVTGKSEDLGKFKVGSLRNIALTAPYMHNGMFGTLREVLQFYNNPKKFVPAAHNTDTLLQRPLGLTKKELRDLEAFLHSLTDKRFMPSNRMSR